MNGNLHPYVIFLPSERKTKTLASIFGSKAAVDVLAYSLKHGIERRMYQKDLILKLGYSNKTIIENLKTLTKLEILSENMEKTRGAGRTTWVKVYELSEAGKWFALLMAEEKDLNNSEKRRILESLFRAYIRWAIDLSKTIDLKADTLKDIFESEMKQMDEDA